MSNELRGLFHRPACPLGGVAQPSGMPSVHSDISRLAWGRVTLVTAGAVSWVSLAYLISEPAGILPKTTIDCIQVGGMDKEAESSLALHLAAHLTAAGKQIRVHAGGREVTISLTSGVVSANPGRASDRAFMLGREFDLSQRIASRWHAAFADGTNVQIPVLISDRLVREVVKDLNCNPLGATTSTHVASGYQNVVMASRNGMSVDANKVRSALASGLANGASSITIPIGSIASYASGVDLSGSHSLRASAWSPLLFRDKGTLTNEGLAIRSIDGLIVAPGQVFDFNRVVGSRTRSRGFRNAGVVIDGKHADAIGGAICQTAGVLDEAVLRAGLEPVERHPHSLGSVTVPLGLDAMIDPTSDFRFRNNTAGPIVVHMRMTRSRVEAAIYGKPLASRIVIWTVAKRLSPTTVAVDTFRRTGDTGGVRSDESIIYRSRYHRSQRSGR